MFGTNSSLNKNKNSERPCLRTDASICYNEIDYEALDPYIKCNKWNCYHGPHNPKFFNNLTNTGQVMHSLEAGKPPQRSIVPGPRDNKKEPWRPYHWDQGGVRKMDWRPSTYYDYSPNLYKERHPTQPYVKPNPHNLLKYHQGLMDLETMHPRKLLETYLYRRVELPHRGAEKCLDEDDGSINVELDKGREDEFKSRDMMGTKMSDMDVWRLRFMSGNYTTFDDWK